MSKVIERWQFKYTTVTEPSAEPVTLDEAKLFARIDTTDDDALVTALISAARHMVEQHTGVALMTQTHDAKINHYPDAKEFELSWRPIQSVEYIRALNEDGTYDEVDSGDILIDGANARVGIKTGSPFFPIGVVGDQYFDGFVIRYVSGYADAASVPEWAKTAIKILVAHWYEYREVSTMDSQNRVPFHVNMILDQHSVVTI